MKFYGKKGTDKPIEIFVALFIILAVAMVILQMFSGQISQKTKELKSIEQSTALKRTIGEAKQMCQELCTTALENDCNDAQRAQFCIKYLKTADGKDGLDLNGNGLLTDYDESLLGGLGVCEDRVFCSQLIDCKCKVKLNMQQCVQILCDYWYSQTNDINRATTFLSDYITAGACYSSTDPAYDKHWYEVLNMAAKVCTI